MPDDNIYRVRSSSEGWGGAPGLNTFYFGVDDTIAADHAVAALDVATRVRAFWVYVNACFPIPWSVTVSPVVDILDAADGSLQESLVVAPPAVLAGSGSDDFGPQVAMISADLLTTQIIDGRRVHGRGFFGPTKPIGDGDGTPSTTETGLFQGGLTELMGGGEAGVPLVVWSRHKGISLHHPTGLGGSAHIVSAITVKDTYAILRSRRQ